jgi:hypothetical protein
LRVGQAEEAEAARRSVFEATQVLDMMLDHQRLIGLRRVPPVVEAGERGRRYA